MYNLNMSPPINQLDLAIEVVERDENIDPRELRSRIDRLEARFSQLVHQATERGDHLVKGHCSAVSWVRDTCAMSQSTASDRLCVGAQLDSLPLVANALRSGEIGYQSASVICHLREKLGDRSDALDEEQWIRFARDFPIKSLRHLSIHMRYVIDPAGFDRDSEENYEDRFLHICEMSGMYQLTGVMDPEAGAALKTAIDSLSKRLGPDDGRSPKQRRADALTEIVHHAMRQGTMPRRNGVRPHVTVTTTLEGLKGELGAAASELEAGMPISSKTVQRLACDGTLCRVLKADSVVVDVGRATRSISPAQHRALKACHRGCAGPGCDRPMNWTHTHHIEFWARGGPNDLPNLLPLCYYHHRLVHEGGWQVIRAGAGIRFIPPDHVVRRMARGPGWARAA
jgi:Domain of unknown function (DUF222)/HNH endonuclease